MIRIIQPPSVAGSGFVIHGTPASSLAHLVDGAS